MEHGLALFMEIITRYLKIKGRVQGVGFRFFTKKNARELNIKGWVKNMPDGSVETVLNGTSEDLFMMIERLKKGPSRARVDAIEELSVEKEHEISNKKFYVER